MSTELEPFMQARNSTGNDFLEKDVTPSITFTEISELRLCAVGTGLTSYTKKWNKKRRTSRQRNNILTHRNTTVLICACVPCLMPNKSRVSTPLPRLYGVVLNVHISLPIPSLYPIRSSIHSVHANVGCDNHVITYASDKCFRLANLTP